MKRFILLPLAILALSAFTSCSKLTNLIIHSVAESEDLTDVAPADTVTIEKKMAVTGTFSHIHTEGGYEIKLVQGDNAINFKGRKVYADNAVLKVSGDTLYISSKEDRFSRGSYSISVPAIKSIFTAGASDINAENFQQSANLEITTAGAADIDIKSSSFNDIKIATAGAGDISVKSVLMHNFHLSTAGAGDINIERITADTIKADMNGAGDLEASGHCKDFICNLNGAGDVNIDKLNVASKKEK
ncbi:MAG: DUF2807 domain-containing protein [Bacteroidaceae bacterium]|nr:DUF2807 domain-containing protein [Bacteroidaceae bacterium]